MTPHTRENDYLVAITEALTMYLMAVQAEEISRRDPIHAQIRDLWIVLKTHLKL